MLVSTSLPVPLYKTFDYKVPTGIQLPKIGCRVQVPFGRQTLVGLVIAYTNVEDCQIPDNKLKTITTIIDKTPIVDEKWLKLASWLSNYYHYPLGDVIGVMLPTLIREGKPIHVASPHWRILPEILSSQTKNNTAPPQISARAYKQIEHYKSLCVFGENGIDETQLNKHNLTKAYLQKLADKQIAERFLQTPAEPKQAKIIESPLSLNDEQSLAVTTIVKAQNKTSYQGFLLNGVTGSGKTEVYLQAMQPVLKNNQQVLILVPEIGLTPQTQARFANRFEANILLLHSGLNNRERLAGWQHCRDGQAQIIIGTRSTLLYPFKNLGLIIVDEAHDASYKQQDTLRYHAADVALYRGLQQNIPVILGTATPSLEHIKLVQDGKLTELALSKRAGAAKPPEFYLVNACNKNTTYIQQANGQAVDSGLTNEVVNAMRKHLQAGEQVLVFINRRGYAPILLCHACGWQADCPRCDNHLTVHQSQLNTQQPSYLKCHHCDWQSYIPTSCPTCGSHNLDAIGMGTTRLTENLHALFANPQTTKQTYPIIQIDRDTTRQKGSWQKIYQTINTGEPAILVGTQMIAKGHHFPNVTLVVMPTADRGFLSADFRSPERTAQLIMQVAGRAGRGEKTGKVLIQTLQPDNPLLLELVKNGYQPFAQTLLNERQMLGLPPFAFAGVIRCEAKNHQQTIAVLNEAKSLLPAHHQLTVLGPVDAAMKKKNNRYQSQLLLLSKNRQQLHTVLNTWWLTVKNLPTAKYVRLTLDIDPVVW
ncbi:primosomal protein N' [Psychrobacter sp. HD31]|uniref:primosomal protein N' n=1 Tax=Psychrobacter sp. HD31 TaxID=3112003 RepID=UPI003DA62155